MESSVLYCVWQKGRECGPYSIEQLRQFISERRFQLSDFAWKSGTKEWVPLSRLTDLDSLPAFTASLLNSGAHHPPAGHRMAFCPKCGARVLAGGAKFCNSCGGAISMDISRALAPIDVRPSRMTLAKWVVGGILVIAVLGLIGILLSDSSSESARDGRSAASQTKIPATTIPATPTSPEMTVSAFAGMNIELAIAAQACAQSFNGVLDSMTGWQVNQTFEKAGEFVSQVGGADVVCSRVLPKITQVEESMVNLSPQFPAQLREKERVWLQKLATFTGAELATLGYFNKAIDTQQMSYWNQAKAIAFQLPSLRLGLEQAMKDVSAELNSYSAVHPDESGASASHDSDSHMSPQSAPGTGSDRGNVQALGDNQVLETLNGGPSTRLEMVSPSRASSIK
jgi:hypothetical protein